MRVHKDHGPRISCTNKPCDDLHEYICPIDQTVFETPKVTTYPFCGTTCVTKAGKLPNGYGSVLQMQAKRIKQELVTSVEE